MRMRDWSSDVCSSDLKGRAHRARIETGRRETVEQHIAVVERAQTVLPLLRDRAFLGQQRPRAILKDDLAEFGIVDPVFPVAQIPDAARHHDRHIVCNPLRTRSEEHTSELQSLMRISYAVFCLKKKKQK